MSRQKQRKCLLVRVNNTCMTQVPTSLWKKFRKKWVLDSSGQPQQSKSNFEQPLWSTWPQQQQPGVICNFSCSVSPASLKILITKHRNLPAQRKKSPSSSRTVRSELPESNLFSGNAVRFYELRSMETPNKHFSFMESPCSSKAVGLQQNSMSEPAIQANSSQQHLHLQLNELVYSIPFLMLKMFSENIEKYLQSLLIFWVLRLPDNVPLPLLLLGPSHRRLSFPWAFSDLLACLCCWWPCRASHKHFFSPSSGYSWCVCALISSGFCLNVFVPLAADGQVAFAFASGFSASESPEVITSNPHLLCVFSSFAK